MFKVKIWADTTHRDSRLVTMELTYPRCIHSEFMTHRMFSRNAASSRAIPIKRMIKDIEDDPFVPIYWGLNKKGMEAEYEHSDPKRCESLWLNAMKNSVIHAERLLDLKLHKQIVNRILEPWMWITVICSGVDAAWENFFKLRCASDAEPHIAKIAYMARDCYDASTSKKDCYHLPLTGFDGDERLEIKTLVKVSVARCARVSYLTHAGLRDVEADIWLYYRLYKCGHWSPFEHVAWPATIGSANRGGNFGPAWIQCRKTCLNEYVTRRPADGI